MELPTFYMNELFSIMERISIDVNIDPSYNFMARVLYGTIDVTIEAIMRLEDYMTIQMIDVVWNLRLYTCFISSIYPMMTFDETDCGWGLKFDEAVCTSLWAAVSDCEDPGMHNPQCGRPTGAMSQPKGNKSS